MGTYLKWSVPVEKREAYDQWAGGLQIKRSGNFPISLKLASARDERSQIAAGAGGEGVVRKGQGEVKISGWTADEEPAYEQVIAALIHARAVFGAVLVNPPSNLTDYMTPTQAELLLEERSS